MSNKETKKGLIWQVEEFTGNVFINDSLRRSAVDHVIPLHDERVYKLPGVDPTEDNEEYLTQLLAPHLHQYRDPEELFDDLGLDYERAGDIEAVQDVIVFHEEAYEADPEANNYGIGNLQDFEPQHKALTFWDGSNMKTIMLNEDVDHETEVEYEEKTVSLDTWDGRNFTFKGQTGVHAYAVPLVSIDGDPEEATGRWLLVEWSQWQGDLDKAEIVTEEELEKIKEEAGVA